MKDRVIKEKLKQETKQLQNNYQFKCLSSFYYYFIISYIKDNTNQTTNYHSYKSKLKILKSTEEDREKKRQRYLSEEIAWTNKEFQKITCGNPDMETDRITLTLPLFNYSLSSEPYKILNTEDCSKRCIVTAPRSDMCSNTKMVIEYNVGMTFWLYFAIRVFIGEYCLNI